MKNKRNYGISVRTVCLLIILSVVLTGCSGQFKMPSGFGGSSQSDNTNKSDGKNQSISDINKDVEEKLKVIEELIDTRFLDEYDVADIEEGIYKGVLKSLGDPYAGYYTKEEYDRIRESAEGTYSGIGAYVSQDVKTGIISIVKPFVNGPAAEAGLLPGDVLYKLNGEEVTGEDLTEVVSNMKGMEGTQVKIEVVREGEPEPLEFIVERRSVEVPTIGYKMLEDNIGYIYITEFDVVTINQFIDAVDTLENDNAKGLIIDLRDNGGGVLGAATAMLDRLISGGLCLYTEDKNGVREEYELTDKQSYDEPIVILMNSKSASASEAFAGAIQDYEAGVVVGTTSFGKGIVQSLIPLSDGSAVKITTSKYYTPKGRSIHEIGIAPDIEEPLDEKLKKELVIKQEDDNQLQKAIEVIKNES